MSTKLPRIARTTGEPDLRFSEDRKQTTSVRLSPSFRREVDSFARAHGMDRTTVVEEALRFYMTVKALDSKGVSNDR